jgi:ATP-dependent DNA helicase RecQ
MAEPLPGPLPDDAPPPWDHEPPPEDDWFPPEGEWLPPAAPAGRPGTGPAAASAPGGSAGRPVLPPTELAPVPDEESLRAEAVQILRDLTGRADADFRDGQWDAISALVREHRRVLVVQRTGWGKSAVYFVASLLQRRRGGGPALIVSPLLALMRDQVAAAERAGVRAAAITSANATEWARIEQDLADDRIDVLLVSPERLVNPRFRSDQLPSLIHRTSLLVVDEAHCISDWGHDFRPDYRRIHDLIGALPDRVPVLATTATANSRVVTDVEEQIAAAGQDVLTVRGALARDSLRLGVLRLERDADRVAWLAAHLGDLDGSGIVYCLTVAAAEDTARTLAEAGHAVRAYTGRTDADERRQLEEDLKENRVKALVATSALGMGFDKPDLGFVVHLGAPSSPIAYYQQVGRAGRATDSADVLLLPGAEDRRIWEYFATSSMPTEDKAAQLLGALAEQTDRAGGRTALSTPALEARVDIKRTPLELLLKVLAVDGAVQNVPGGWVGTGAGWDYDAERYGRIAAARRDEAAAMLAYQTLDSCRMEFLVGQLDDPAAGPCGRCDVCAGTWFPTDVPPAAAGAASKALDRVGVPVDPRGQWPSGLAPLGLVDDRPGGTGAPLKGKIPVADRPEPGRVLARLTDLGWGGPLRDLFAPGPDGAAVDTEVPAALAQACVRVLAEWGWSERPVAVVSVPSLSRPRLVASLADGLARVGRLQDLGPLSLAPGADLLPGSRNSAYRLRDVWDRFAVGPELADGLAALAGAPVLLVDDRIDSRWTVTVAAQLLRRSGSGPVLPFALAAAG